MAQNVQFLTVGHARPSARVRVLNLLPFLKRDGIVADALEIPPGLMSRLMLFSRLRNADAVVLQRKLLNPLEALWLRRCTRRLLFDFDDAIFLRNADTADVESGTWFSLTRTLKFRSVLRHCDTVLAGNRYLAEAAERVVASERIEVLPSAVPVTGVPQREQQPENPIPVLGWVGSKGNLRYLRELGPVLSSLPGEQPFVLHVVSDTELVLPGVEVQNIPWTLTGQEHEIACFDVGLMPLPDNPWTRGKCAYKLLQYMAAGVPFAASAVGMNVDVAAGETTGFTATDHREFREKLLRLLGDASLRRRMGRCGRELVERRYSLEAVAGKFANILDGGDRGAASLVP